LYFVSKLAWDRFIFHIPYLTTIKDAEYMTTSIMFLGF